jgi:TPR repeat protein
MTLPLSHATPTDGLKHLALQRLYERGYALSLRQKTRIQGQKLLLLAAEKGHVEACVRAGFMMNERDDRERLWQYAASLHGHTEALLLLGHLLSRAPTG